MIQITEVAYTGYPVTDMARARAFYEGVLGLKTGLARGPATAAWVEYEIGPAVLAISNMAPEWKPSDQGASIALEVSNFDEAIRFLREKNVPITVEPFETPVCRMAIISDPDGNSVTIHKRNAG